MSAVFTLNELDAFLPQLFLPELLSVTAYLSEEDEDDGKEDETDNFCKQLDSSRFVRRMSISLSSPGTSFLICLYIRQPKNKFTSRGFGAVSCKLTGSLESLEAMKL